MKFDKFVNTILEGQTIQNNYIVIDPFDYSEVLMEHSEIEDDKGRVLYELYKVTNVIERKKIGDYRANNLHHIRSEHLEQLPEDVKKNWVKKYIAYGRDMIYLHNKLAAGSEGIIKNAVYIVNNTKKFDPEDVTTAYLKPSDIAGEVKDTFSDLYSEL